MPFGSSRRTVSSGKTLSSFVRSAIHIVDSLRARLPSPFDRRVFPTTPIFRCFSVTYPFPVHASYHARYAPHLVSLQKSPRVSSRSRQCPLLSSSSIRPSLFYQRSSAVASSSSRFSTHFSAFPLPSDSPLSRPLSQPFVISLQPSHVHFCFSNPLCYCLSFSVSNPRECLSSTSLFAPCLPPPTNVSSPSIYHPFHAPALSLFLSLAVSHQLTHTLRRRQAPVPCGLVLRARGCCEIIVSPRPSRNQPPRVTPRRGKQQ